jgi:hypothetical protein
VSLKSCACAPSGAADPTLSPGGDHQSDAAARSQPVVAIQSDAAPAHLRALDRDSPLLDPRDPWGRAQMARRTRHGSLLDRSVRMRPKFALPVAPAPTPKKGVNRGTACRGASRSRCAIESAWLKVLPTRCPRPERLALPGRSCRAHRGPR